MKQVAAFNFKRPTSAWLFVADHEWQALDGLPAWATRCFLLLLAFSDFKTGNGRTGYGELITRMTPDQPESGPRLWAPSHSDVKRMLRRLESLGLVAIDKTASEKRKALIFHVRPRTRETTSAKKLAPELAPTRSSAKQATARLADRSGGELAPQTRPGDSEKNTYPLPPVDKKLSTAPESAKARLAQLADRLRSGAPSAVIK